MLSPGSATATEARRDIIGISSAEFFFFFGWAGEKDTTVFERDENRMENNCRLTSGIPNIDYAFLLMFHLLQSSINVYETTEAIEVY